MCGIIGVVGIEPCVEFIFSGLKKLEYRGYDSAGIAVVDEDTIKLAKSEGKLICLEAMLDSLPKASSIGLGHTRWATHGRPSIENAHPHHSLGTAIIHNGILENYQTFKIELLEAGVNFQSETDSEVFLHLFNREMLKCGANIKAALVKLVEKLQGTYAFGVVTTMDPDSIYVMKEGSPLVIAKGENSHYFASDVIALVDQAHDFIFLEDGEIAKITAKAVTIWNRKGEVVERDFVTLHCSESRAEKEGFRHFMLKEIHEQPKTLKTRFEPLQDLPGPENIEDVLLSSRLDWDRITNVTITGCGSAYLAGMVGKYILEPILRLPVRVELASELRYQKPFVDRGSLLIAITQSGETADTLASVKLFKSAQGGAQILALSNSNYSSIVREASSFIDMEAGPEIGVASTKAFTAMIRDLFLLGIAARYHRHGISQAAWEAHCENFDRLPALCAEILAKDELITQLAERIHSCPSCLFIGRGISFPIALEGALKLKEISYIHAEGYAGGELKHGPIALIDSSMPTIAVLPFDRHREKMLSNVQEITARNGFVLGIGAENDVQLRELCSAYFPCPQINNEALQGILSVIPLQLLSYTSAVFRGTDVDQPRNLAKSVTVE